MLEVARLLIVPTRAKRKWKLSALVLLVLVFTASIRTSYTSKNYNALGDFFQDAILNCSYTTSDGRTGYWKAQGKYGLHSKFESARGHVFHVITDVGKNHGCSIPENNIPPNTMWIALIKRGGCRFEQKIENAAVKHNASAVIVYNNMSEKHLILMSHTKLDAISVFISKEDGDRIVFYLTNHSDVQMTITVGARHDLPKATAETYNNSVFFVSISFIVLMIISLAWLVFYYIQRFRYAHAKERLSRRLSSAAKKAISKIPLRTLKTGEKETLGEWEQCAVCIENYKAHEVVRTLPCRHLFHKSCVDPWLLDHRSCPICKMDILKAYGLQVHGATTENIMRYDLDAPSSSSMPDAMDGPELLSEGGIEIVHIRPPIVQVHTSSAANVHTANRKTQTGDTEEEQMAETSVGRTPRGALPGLSNSTESIHSLGTEYNEYHSLVINKSATQEPSLRPSSVDSV